MMEYNKEVELMSIEILVPKMLNHTLESLVKQKLEIRHAKEGVSGFFYKLEGVYYLIWDCGMEPTRIDGSDKCNAVLKYCELV